MASPPSSAPAFRPPQAPPREIDVSVLVPAKDEAENLPLFMELAAEMIAAQPHRYEIVVVDDGSADRTWTVLQELAERYPFLKLAR
ncbi:MAG TPA: glycosyltransferase, partial [Gemmatimonadaceae bacterium]|nr:glycosyltransferase [Gemmatimonadaceae bacterium]